MCEDPLSILDDPPESDKIPGYTGLWKKRGAPVKHTHKWEGGQWIELLRKPVKHLVDLNQRTVAQQRGRNETIKLARHFVKHYLDRYWTKADYGGMQMAHAKQVLAAGYTYDQVVECLERLKRGDLTDGVPWKVASKRFGFKSPWWTVRIVLKGEPPYIEQQPSSPPAYNTSEWRTWHEKNGLDVPIPEASNFLGVMHLPTIMAHTTKVATAKAEEEKWTDDFLAQFKTLLEEPA